MIIFLWNDQMETKKVTALPWPLWVLFHSATRTKEILSSGRNTQIYLKEILKTLKALLREISGSKVWINTYSQISE